MGTIQIYKYGDMYKLILYKHIAFSNENDEDKIILSDECKKYRSDEKLANNIRRAKNKILEYALCNDWDYFGTFTINKEKQDRFNLDAYHRAFGDWIHNYNMKYNTSLKYVSIPEQHEKGGWHEHAILTGIAKDSLITNEHGYLDIPYYRNRFGYVSISPIRDRTKCAFYITKYINKDMYKRVRDVGKHLYYSSKGLDGKKFVEGFGGVEIDKEYINNNMWENDYLAIQWFKDIPQYIIDVIKDKEYDTDISNVFNASRPYRVDI